MPPTPPYVTGAATGTRGLAVAGLALAGSFALAFGAWAGLAPISGAVLANGVVAAAGQNQNVQHLEGGIVEEILVAEGDRVERGQPLVRLDETPARSRRNRLEAQLVGLGAKATRLVAERDGLDAIEFDMALRSRANERDLTHLLVEQAEEFAARLSRHRQERFILTQRLDALGEQVNGLKAQHEAVERQLVVVREEAERKKHLLDQGLTDRSEYTALIRSEADLVGQVGQIQASILASRTQAAEAREQLAKLATQRVETAVTELNAVRVEHADRQEQFEEALNVLARTIVRAPDEGIVVRMGVNAKGGVIEPAGAILELLPTSRELLIDARVAPQDIDALWVGQPARLRFSALNQRKTPTVEAEVTYISADRLTGGPDEAPYYMARLALSQTLPAEISRGDIGPGMPVEVFISTQERTFAQYLVKPIEDSFNRAFREE